MPRSTIIKTRYQLVTFGKASAPVFATRWLWLAKLCSDYWLLRGRLLYLLDTSKHESLQAAYEDFGTHQSDTQDHERSRSPNRKKFLKRRTPFFLKSFW